MVEDLIYGFERHFFLQTIETKSNGVLWACLIYQVATFLQFKVK